MRSPPTTWRTCGPSRTADPVSALPGGEDVRLGKRQPHRPLLQVQQQHLVVTLTHQWRRDIQGLLGADVPVAAHAEAVDIGDAVAGVGDVEEGVGLLGGLEGGSHQHRQCRLLGYIGGELWRLRDQRAQLIAHVLQWPGVGLPVVEEADGLPDSAENALALPRRGPKFTRPRFSTRISTRTVRWPPSGRRRSARWASSTVAGSVSSVRCSFGILACEGSTPATPA